MKQQAVGSFLCLFISRWLVLWAWALVAMLNSLDGSAFAAEPAGPEVVTCVRQMNELLGADARHLCQARLAGTVYGVDRTHRSLVLKDDTGFVWLELETLPESIEPGAQVELEGRLAVGYGRAFLGRAAVVECDPAENYAEHSGQLHLEAGKQPFVIEYYQKSGRCLLEVILEGPGFPRERIPAGALWRPGTNAPDELVRGLRFDYYETNFSSFADFKDLTPAKSDVTQNFAARLGSANNNFGVRFTGFVGIRSNGVHQFTLLADDAARLWIGPESASRLAVTGRTNLAPPRRMHPGQAWEGIETPSWVEAEGTVRKVGTHRGQLRLELVSEMGRMEAIVSDGDASVGQMLLNNRVRVTGLGSSAIISKGDKIAGALRAPDMSHLAVTEVTEVNWQSQPVSTIGSLLTNRNAGPSSMPVRFRGTAAEAAPGRGLQLRDQTGQIEVRTRFAWPEDGSAEVEVLGLPAWEGENAVLRLAACRPAMDQLAASNSLPTLTSIEQIRQLKTAEANLKYPVQFKGVITFVFPGGARACIQGDADAVYLDVDDAHVPPLRVGDLCEIEGHTEGGIIAPTVLYQRCTVLGSGKLPEPSRPTWSQLMNGSLSCQWVEIQGVVLGIKSNELLVGMYDGEIIVRVFQAETQELKRFLNAGVRVRGTVNVMIKNKREVSDVVIQASSPLDITVDAPPPADIFARPVQPIKSLLFDPHAESVHLVKVAGQVVHVRGQIFHLMDGTNGLRFMVRGNTEVAVGERVEVVGLPLNDGRQAVLRQASVRRKGKASLPEPHLLTTGDLAENLFDSTLVRLEARVLNVRTNPVEQVLELMAGPRVFLARLDTRLGQLPAVMPESRVQITGVFTSQGAASGNARANTSTTELLMNSAADLVILERPSWWNLRHALLVLGVMGLALAGAFTWITALRRRVERRTRELREEVAEHQRTEAQLQEKTGLLQTEIEQRKRMQIEVERIHRELVDASRQAGQAEVAAGVLHNVGNVLNSVNVSANLVTEKVHKLPLPSLRKVVDLLRAHAGDLGGFLTTDEKGRRLPDFLDQLEQYLAREREGLLAELDRLGTNLEHIKEIVSMQQAYAKRSGVRETVLLPDLIETTLKLHAAAFERHAIVLERDFEPVPEVVLDKHKVMQILVNLFQNAKYACSESGRPERKVTVRLRRENGDRVRVEVMDNGVGIAPENMTRIFSHGFTTRKNGHGFGLHSSALAAKEMSGSLSAHSDGPGRGARFTLELPVQPDELPVPEGLAADELD